MGWQNLDAEEGKCALIGWNTSSLKACSSGQSAYMDGSRSEHGSRVVCRGLDRTEER